MSYQQSILEQLEELYNSVPTAFVFENAVYQTTEWSSTKKGKTYVIKSDGQSDVPNGYHDIEEGQTYYVGKCGDHVIAVLTDKVKPLFTKPSENALQWAAANICHALDINPFHDSSMDDDDYGYYE